MVPPHRPKLRRQALRWSLVLAAALCSGACGGSAPAPPAAAPALDPATTGTLSGRITLAGTRPLPQTIRLDGDRKCMALVAGGVRATESYVVGEGGTLANVFVYVKTGLEGHSFPVPEAPVILDQQQCWYTPRVIGVRVGQPFQVLNSDPLLHNLRADANVNEPIYQGQPVQGMRYSHTFSTAEVMVPFKCDVHAWMNAWVGVVNHPYFAVTSTDGAYTLPDLPAGTYTVEAWHEAAGTVSGLVTVPARGTSTLALTFEVPAA